MTSRTFLLPIFLVVLSACAAPPLEPSPVRIGGGGTRLMANGSPGDVFEALGVEAVIPELGYLATLDVTGLVPLGRNEVVVTQRRGEEVVQSTVEFTYRPKLIVKCASDREGEDLTIATDRSPYEPGATRVPRGCNYSIGKKHDLALRWDPRGTVTIDGELLEGVDGRFEVATRRDALAVSVRELMRPPKPSTIEATFQEGGETVSEAIEVTWRLPLDRIEDALTDLGSGAAVDWTPTEEDPGTSLIAFDPPTSYGGPGVRLNYARSYGELGRLQDVDLFAYRRAGDSSKLRTCGPYGQPDGFGGVRGGSSVALHGTETIVEVRDRSGQVVHERTFAPETSCPGSVSEGTSRYDNGADTSEIEAWLRGLVKA